MNILSVKRPWVAKRTTWIRLDETPDHFRGVE